MAKAASDVFVIMPFGLKTISANNTSINYDFDSTYRNLIVPACKASGKSVTRIDEFVFSGAISRSIVQQLMLARIVIADVTRGNANVLYELGFVKH